MCNLVQELKEKHNRQKRYLLTTIKNYRGHRYKHRETHLDNFQESVASSEDNNDFSAGIVVSKPIFKEEGSAKLEPDVPLDTPDEAVC